MGIGESFGKFGREAMLAGALVTGAGATEMAHAEKPQMTQEQRVNVEIKMALNSFKELKRLLNEAKERKNNANPEDAGIFQLAIEGAEFRLQGEVNDIVNDPELLKSNSPELRKVLLAAVDYTALPLNAWDQIKDKPYALEVFKSQTDHLAQRFGQPSNSMLELNQLSYYFPQLDKNNFQEVPEWAKNLWQEDKKDQGMK